MKLSNKICKTEFVLKSNTVEKTRWRFLTHHLMRSENVLLDTLWFFEIYLRIGLHKTRIKACHILPGTGNDYVLPSVIIKFIYFDDKNNVYNVYKLLKKRKNKINGRNNYINEHLPKVDAELKNEANKQGFITSTNNCKVSVLVSKANNTIGYHRINFNVSTLSNVKMPVINANWKKTTMGNQFVLPT